MSHMSDFDDCPFSLPHNWGKYMDFLKFFFTSGDKILETISSRFYKNYMITARMISFNVS